MPSSVEIVCIFFDGLVRLTESDEYVELRNAGGSPAQLEGWTLIDSADGRPSFVLPNFLLGAGESLRVYTNKVHPETGGFSFGSGTAIWNNSDPDTATLLDPQGGVVSSKSYPPGC